MDLKVVLVAALALVSCRSAGTDPSDAGLSGTYRWVRSAGGIAGRTFTPASEGYSIRFSFSGSQVTAFRNDSAKATAIVTMRGNDVTYQPSLSAFLFDPAIDTQTIRPLAGDTIALADPCCDRFEHIFVRLP